MPTPGFAELEGAEQGPIEGSCRREGREGQLEIYAFDHVIELPRFEGHGLPLGRPIHGFISVNKEVDQSTPKLYQALLTRERLSKVIFSWMRYTPSGVEAVFYRVRLINAIITRIQPTMADFFDPAAEGYRFMESISFAYERIVWSWGANGDIEYEDAWNIGAGER
jgi:type VI secretion system secreted protein Hcp